MAFSGVAALIAAVGEGAAITAGMVLTAVAEVGTAMTVVGAVTGNKDLMKVGGVMSLVGGIGSLAAGAMSGVGAAGAAGDVAVDGAVDAASSGIVNSAIDSSLDTMTDAAASAAGDTAAQVITNPLDASLQAGTASSPGFDAAGMSTSVNPTAATSATDAAAGTTTAVAPGQAAAGQANTLAGDTSVAGQTAAAQPLQPLPELATPGGNVTGATAPPATTPAITNPTDARLAAGSQGALGGTVSAPLDSTSYLQKVMSYVQDPRNKTMLELGSKVVGGAMQGMQQESQFKQKVDLEKQRLGQTSYGSQVGQNRPHGVIAGARS